MYGFNGENITKLPSGAPMRRTDELGEFVLKYSDDGVLPHDFYIRHVNYPPCVDMVWVEQGGDPGLKSDI